MAGGLILAAAFLPKFASLLTTIPQCVLGGATITVFASITMTGMRLITGEKMTYRSMSIVGLSVALGPGHHRGFRRPCRLPRLGGVRVRQLLCGDRHPHPPWS